MACDLEVEDTQSLLTEAPTEVAVDAKAPLGCGRAVARAGSVTLLMLAALSAIWYLSAHREQGGHQFEEGESSEVIQRAAVASIIDGSVGEASRLLVKGAGEAASGAWSSAFTDLSAGIGDAGTACVDIVSGLSLVPAANPVIVACGALALGSDIMKPSASDDMQNVVQTSLGPLQDEVGNLNDEYEQLLQALEDVVQLIHCQALSDKCQTLRTIKHQYEDSMAAGQVMDSVYPSFAEWSACVDDPALRAFWNDMEGCNASAQHLTAFVAARTQMYALEILYYKSRGNAEMLQHVEGKKDGDMRQFQQTQKELCLYDSSQMLAACRGGRDPDAINRLCVKNVDLPRDLTHFPGEDLLECPASKRAGMGGYLIDLPRSLVYADFSNIPNFVGDVSDLPSMLAYADFSSATAIRGELSSLNESVTYANFRSASRISGDLGWLPSSVTHADFGSAWNISGDLEELPPNLTYANFDAAGNVYGSLWNLPLQLTYASFSSAADIEGFLEDLPRQLTYADFRSAEEICGDVSDLPSMLSYGNFDSAKNITGDLTDLPKSCSVNDCKFRAAWRNNNVYDSSGFYILICCAAVVLCICCSCCICCK